MNGLRMHRVAAINVISGLLILFASVVILPTVHAQQAEERLLPKLLNYDVIIDVGHGGIDSGTFYGTLLEKNLNLAFGLQLYHELKNMGYQVGITRMHDYALSDDYKAQRIRSRHQRDLTQRKLIGEGLRPKLFISLHVNYSSYKAARGPVIIYQKKGTSYLFAQLLQHYLNDIANKSQSSIPSSKYFLLQSVKSPTLIAEVGYISHPQERMLLQQPAYQKQVAQTIARAVEDYFTLYPLISP